METKIISILAIIGCLFLIMGVSGCSDDITSIFLKNYPDVKAFMDQNPGTELKVAYLSEDYVSKSIDKIRAECGEQMEVIPYYLATITTPTEDGNETSEFYTDENEEDLLCALSRINYANGTSIMTFSNNETWEETNESGDTEEDLPTLEAVRKMDAENELEQMLCSEIPKTAFRMPVQLLDVRVKAPYDLEQKASDMGDQLTINMQSYLVKNYSGERYFDCFVSGYESCIIPIQVKLSDPAGEIATETGAIYLTFTGSIGPYVPEKTEQPTVDGPAQVNFIGQPPNEMLQRTSCQLQIDRECQVPQGSSFCGQCSYSNNIERQTEYRGTCWTCPSGTSCSGGDDTTHCAKVYCDSGGARTDPTATTTGYWISCSGCQYNFNNLYYNNLNYNWCSYYRDACEQSACADIKSTC